jgi:long-chain acyl-CoA synthetase
LIDLASEHLRNTASSFARHVALVDGDRELTWSEFDQAVERLARRLVAAGLLPGDRVAILSENSAEFLMLCFGAWRAGGVMAVVHASIGPNELDYALVNAEPQFVFAENECRATAAAALKRSGIPAQMFELAAGFEVLGHISPFAGDLPEVDADALGIIGYTSGTTGMPKPVAHSHRTIAHGTDAVAKLWRIVSADTILVAIPLSWMMGLIILCGTAATRGTRIYLLRRFTADDALDAMINRGVTFFAGPTSMYAKIVNAWRQRNLQGNFQLRCCISAGEARNEAVFDEWRNITGTTVLDSYGAFECWPLVTHDPGIGILPPRGAAGRVVAGAKLRLLGPHGQEVARGEVGEAQGLAPCMMLGYWKEPGLTAKAITPDKWYRTGDYARIDADGYVYILGRTGDLIIHDGENVFSAEVEQVLSELDYLAQVAVVGLPDPEHGQLVAAAVVTMPGAKSDEAAMQAHCATRLAWFKVPSMIRVVKELPHNASGKVLRREVIPILSRIREAEKA